MKYCKNCGDSVANSIFFKTFCTIACRCEYKREYEKLDKQGKKDRLKYEKERNKKREEQEN